MDIKCGLSLQKSSAFETMSCCTVPAPPPPPLPLQPHFVRTLSITETGKITDSTLIMPDAPDSPPHAHDIDIALAPCFNAEELPVDTALLDLPLPEPGAKGGISVQEAAEVKFANIYHVMMLYAGSLAALSFFPNWKGKRQVFSRLASVFYSTSPKRRSSMLPRERQPRKVFVAEAEARRQERRSQTNQQAAETLKRRKEERGDEFYKRQRGRQAAESKFGVQ